jgi:hypothetical protein
MRTPSIKRRETQMDNYQTSDSITDDQSKMVKAVVIVAVAYTGMRVIKGTTNFAKGVRDGFRMQRQNRTTQDLTPTTEQ